MRPIYLKLTDFKSHSNTELAFDGMRVVAITGTNGAGKTSILEGILYALHGPDALGLGKRVDTIVREGTTEANVTLEFELGGTTYRIRRSRKSTGGGKTTLYLDRWTGELLDDDRTNVQLREWEPMTGPTGKETQAIIDQLLGAGAETFRQTIYVGQGDAARFAKASPAERKEIIGEALDLGQYPQLQEKAREQLRVADASVRIETSRIEDLTASIDETVTTEALAAARAALEMQQEHRAAAQSVLDAKRSELADARVAAAAIDTARRLAAERRSAASTAATDAAAARSAVERLDSELRVTGAVASDLATLEEALGAAVDVAPLEEAADEAGSVANTLRSKLQEAIVTRRRYDDAKAAAENLLRELNSREADVEEAVAALDAFDAQAAPCCPTCEQEVKGAAHAKARDAIAAKGAAAAQRHEAAKLGHAAAVEAATAIAGELANVDELTAMVNEADALATAARLKVKDARETNQRRSAQEAAIAKAKAASDRLPDLTAAHAAAIAKRDELTQRHAELDAAAKEAEAAIEPGAGERLVVLEREIVAAGETVERHATAIATNEREATRIEERLSAAQRARDEVTQAQARLTAAEAAQRRWGVLDRAFGRDGIPKQVLRYARPALERDANELLASVGAPYRIRIDLERMTGAGTVQDALDLTILADGQERPFDLLSGGEQYRVNIALRFAICRILAQRSGARLETLVLDEPEGLDTAGFAALAELLEGLAGEFGLILTVSHTDGLESACDTKLRVTKAAAGSSVEVLA